MKRFKKATVAILATTMAFSGSISVFADDPVTSLDGTATVEGHVDKKKVDVVLPTVASTDDTFKYTIDPERLVQETSGAKYTAATFPAKASDTGVYFHTGKVGGTGEDKDNAKYENTSASLKVINKSSDAISLTVKAEATTGAKDLPLVEKSAIANAQAASLYLGLVVNAETAVAVTKDTAATKTVSIAGTPANFKTAVKADKSGYEYRALTLDEYKALDGNSSKTQDDFDATWAAAEFKLEGSVTSGKAIASDTTAPTVKVTWSWVDPSATAAPSATANISTLSDDTDVVMTYNLGLGDDAAESVTSVTVKTSTGAEGTLSGTAFCTIDTTAKTVTISKEYGKALIDGDMTGAIYTINFNNGKKASCTVGSMS